ncbi:hypothetical protein LSH36_832g01042 [Paralvinella palmiformis]|uniref:Uncharacterized protein n=1 Tax=Paralvinella palmiformis TaxID=53620 RepID=A0AAD9MRY2_9ANNE|nr:hypothetical protein LSH36_832g01042 [Paralvinella palmiformis]
MKSVKENNQRHTVEETSSDCPNNGNGTKTNVSQTTDDSWGLCDESPSGTLKQMAGKEPSLMSRDDHVVKIPVEDIPMTLLDQSSDDVQEDSPIIHRRPTPSSDPSATMDSMGTMNVSIYSASSSIYTGTLKRGKKDQVVEVQLQLTQGEIDRLNRSTITENRDKESPGLCSAHRGPHVLLLSILFLPFAFISSLFVNLYICTLCWYNIYLCLSEEKTIWHKIFLCPLLIVIFPLIVFLIPLAVAAFAAIRQLSWSWRRWLNEIRDFEKGFYGSLCEKLGVPECSPYEVVILNENGALSVMDENMPGTVI